MSQSRTKSQGRTGVVKPILFAATLSVALAATSAAQDASPVRAPDARARTGASQSASPAARRTLAESLRAAGGFTKLLLLLDRAGLTDTLSDSTKGLTLFAPDDAAFARLPAALVAKLTDDRAQARAFLLPYILDGKLTSKELTPRSRLRTFAGTTLQVSRRGGDAGLIVIFDSAKTGVGGSPTGWPCCGRVTSADHVAANGVYHVISFAAASGGVWR